MTSATHVQKLSLSPVSLHDDGEELELVPIEASIPDDHEPLLGIHEAEPSKKDPVPSEAQPYDPPLEKTSPVKSRVALQSYDEEKVLF